MNQHEILSKLSDLKGNLQHLISRVHRHDKSSAVEDATVEVSGDDNYVDDLPLTLNREAGPSVKYYTTENSEFARGAEKEAPRGIDSFGERDTFSFEEADDFQTNRDRNQNSDLSQRFYTDGLNFDGLN